VLVLENRKKDECNDAFNHKGFTLREVEDKSSRYSYLPEDEL